MHIGLQSLRLFPQKLTEWIMTCVKELDIGGGKRLVGSNFAEPD